MSPTDDAAADKCPVDHTTRAAWLKANPNTETFASASKAINPQQTTSSTVCDSSQIDQSPPSTQPRSFFSRWLWTSPADAPRQTPSKPIISPTDLLATDREISTIPRAHTSTNEDKSTPANSESESGTHASGNWIYPSEKMFFEAMKRKGHGPKTADMRTIVPIHNAVNERAWREILQWEEPYNSKERCGGPKLQSFLGNSKDLTPKARINTWLGYAPPFDRHDWVVDRCGLRVDYVIDFYQGRDEKIAGKGLNFYLDVRPKLNSWEGVKMRASKAVGLV